MTDYDILVAHYASLASHEGWQEYVWHRVKQMAAESPKWYASLPDDVKNAVLARKGAV